MSFDKSPKTCNRMLSSSICRIVHARIELIMGSSTIFMPRTCATFCILSFAPGTRSLCLKRNMAKEPTWWRLTMHKHGVEERKRTCSISLFFLVDLMLSITWRHLKTEDMYRMQKPQFFIHVNCKAHDLVILQRDKMHYRWTISNNNPYLKNLAIQHLAYSLNMDICTFSF